MPPKKGKKGEEAEAQKGAVVTEVEKQFLELQIAECNRKIARLRTAVDDYELRNEELQKAYDKLDEDRADIIAFLKKTLNLKNEENFELKEKVKGLEETREIETAQFKETVQELEKNFTVMKDQLTSENKLLAGKLNTLEEFRAIRDDLMKKFEKQEQDFKDQEMKYKRVIYDAEKKFVIGKDKLKKEMEARLLQLAQDFQDATELRIAASTHRVIRENIAINNELDSILSTQTKLSEQNEKFKEQERSARAAMELAEEERDKAINKNVVQLKVIDQLTTAFQEMKKERAQFEKRNYDFETLQAKIQILSKENDQLALQVRILEQNLHARMSDQNKANAHVAKIVRECSKLKKILKEAAIAVQAALKLDQWATVDPSRDLMDRQLLLSRLLEIITQYREITRAESMDTLASFGKIYDEGDLGFIPKPELKTSATPQPRRTLVQTPMISVPSRLSVEEMRALLTPTQSSPSLVSLKTIPSTQIVPQSSAQVLPERESLQSFATSTKSTESEISEGEEEEEEEKMDIEKQIARSKLEIQKSILKDLAYSQTAMKSQVKFAEEESPKNSHEESEGGERVGEEIMSEHTGEHLGEGEEQESTEGEALEEQTTTEKDQEETEGD